MKRLAKRLVMVVCLLTFTGSLFAAAPPNDNFANRILLSGTNVSFSGDNTEATGEPNEPPTHLVVIPLRTLWWTWTSPASGRVRFRFTSHDTFFQPYLTIYTGSSLTNLAFQAHNLGGFTTGFPGYVDVSVRGGVALQIVTEGVGTQQIGPHSLTLEWIPAPANDDFAGRIVLSGLPAAGLGEFDGTTRDPAEPRPFLNDGLPYSQFGGHSLWWTWTSPINGAVEVTNAGTFTEATLAVFTGTNLSTLQNIFRDSLPSPGAALFPVQAGETYQLMFDTRSAFPSPGTVDFQINSATPPANDAFAARSEVTGANFNLVGLNTAATSEPGEPPHAPNAAGRTLWWTWTAPSPGRVEFTSYSVRAVIAFYTGEAVNNLTRIGAGIPTNSPVSITVPTGGTYQFAVDSLDGEFGEVHLAAHFIPRPANDDFANRIVVSNTVYFATAPLLAEATLEPGEPWPKKRERFAIPVSGSSIRRSVWWTFIAPQAGNLNIQGDMNVAVFEGDSLTSLRTLADDQFSVSIVLRSNQVIHVAGRNLGERLPALPTAPGFMSFAFAPFPANDSFAGRTTIAGTYFDTTNVNFGASAEKGEPRIANNASGSTVWYSWTAPAMGTVVFAAVSADFYPIVSAYTGDKLSALHSIASAGSTRASVAVVRFEAVEGTTYTFAVDGESSSGEPPRGRVEIGLLFSTIRLASPEADAIFHSRDPVTFAITTPDPNVEGNITNVQYWAYLPDAEQRLIGSVGTPPYSLTVSNLPQGTFAVVAFAKNDLGEERFTPEILLHVRPYNDDWAQRRVYRDYEWRDNANMIASTRERGERGGRPVGGTVWYSWIAPANGTATITHYDLSERTPITIYTGESLRKLRRVAWRLGYGDVSFAAVAGQEYFINITEPPRIPDQYTPFSSLIFSFDAPLINNVTNGQIFTGGAAVPLTVLPPPGIAGVQRIDYLDGTNVIAVGVPPNFDAVWLNAVPGHRILNGRVVLSDESSFLGHPIPITVRPANDHFAERAPLVGTNFSFPIYTTTGTSEPNEPIHGLALNGGTAWWTWTAPSDGTLVLEVVGAAVPALTLYTGATFPTLFSVAQNIRYNPAILNFEQSRELMLHVSAGTTYQMAAAGGNDTATLLFRFEAEPPQ